MKSILFSLAAAVSIGSTSCSNVNIGHANIYARGVRDRCGGLMFNHLPGPSGVVLGADGNSSYYSTGEGNQPMSDAERARLQGIQDHGIGFGTSYYR